MARGPNEPVVYSARVYSMSKLVNLRVTRRIEEQQQMGNVFFIYTLTLLVICILASATSLSAYFVSHRVVFALSTALFLFYFFDLALIFQDEFLVQNLAFDPSTFYLIENPFWKIVMGAGFLVCMWFIICDYIDIQNRLLQVLPLAIFIAASIGIYLFMPTGPMQQFLFYSMRTLFLIWEIAFIAFFFHARRDDKIMRMRLQRRRTLYIIFCILTVCVLCEDVVNILIVDPSSFDPSFPLYLSERSFSENILLIVLAFYAFSASRHTLSLRLEKPPISDNESVQKFIDSALATYCVRHGLSEREGEVLRLVLIGKDTQNIASAIQLAVGTVKAHIHNILKKTGTSSRQDLIRAFWEE